MGEFMPKPLTCTSPSPWPCSSSSCGTSLRRESLPWGSWAPRLPLPVPWGLWPSPGMWHLVLSPAGGPRGPLGVPIPPPQPHNVAPLSPHKQGFVHPPPSPALQGGICWANNGNRPGFVGMRERGGIALQPSGDSPGQRDPLWQNPPWRRRSRMGRRQHPVLVGPWVALMGPDHTGG